jgi:hypothetical protein
MASLKQSLLTANRPLVAERQDVYEISKGIYDAVKEDALKEILPEAGALVGKLVQKEFAIQVGDAADRIKTKMLELVGEIKTSFDKQMVEIENKYQTILVANQGVLESHQKHLVANQDILESHQKHLESIQKEYEQNIDDLNSKLFEFGQNNEKRWEVFTQQVKSLQSFGMDEVREFGKQLELKINEHKTEVRNEFEDHRKSLIETIKAIPLPQLIIPENAIKVGDVNFAPSFSPNFSVPNEAVKVSVQPIQVEARLPEKSLVVQLPKMPKMRKTKSTKKISKDQMGERSIVSEESEHFYDDD